MAEKKQRVSGYISDELYVKLTQSQYSITEAITLGLERRLEPEIEDITDNNAKSIRKL